MILEYNLPPWKRYSQKIHNRLERPLYCGLFHPEDTKDRGMRLVVARACLPEEAIRLALYWLVDEIDGVIADAKFQAVGPTGLIAVSDASCELALRKNYDQVSRFSAELMERHLLEGRRGAFKEWAPFFNLVMEAIDLAVEQCQGIPFTSTYEATPLEEDLGEIPGGLPGWEEWPYEKKMAILEEVVDREIRPYIELDAGGVKILKLEANGEVKIAYEGACTSCYASTGSTLSAIQKILRSRVHPSLRVIPEL